MRTFEFDPMKVECPHCHRGPQQCCVLPLGTRYSAKNSVDGYHKARIRLAGNKE